MKDHSTISLQYVCTKEGNKFVETTLFVILSTFVDRFSNFTEEQLAEAFKKWYDNYKISETFNISDVPLDDKERKEYEEIANKEVNTEEMMMYLISEFLHSIGVYNIPFEIEEVKSIVDDVVSYENSIVQ